MATEQRSSTPSGDGVGEEFRRGREEAQELGSEFGEFANDVRFLVQKEAELARAEFQESMSHAMQSAVAAVVAGVFANILLIFAFATAMFALDTFLELWLSALITTGIIFLITAAALVFARMRMKQVSFTPQRTMKSIQEDLEWAKTQIRSTAS